MKSYSGDHDFLRWQRRVLRAYEAALGEVDDSYPAIDLYARYCEGEYDAEAVGRELAEREKTRRAKR